MGKENVLGGLESLGGLGGLSGLFGGGGGEQEFPFQDLADRLNSFLRKGIERGGLPGFVGLSPEQEKIISQFLETTFPAGLEALSSMAQQDSLGRAETLLAPARERALEQTRRSTRERLNLGNNLFSTGGQFAEAEATSNIEAQFLSTLAQLLPALDTNRLKAIGALPGFTGQGISIGDIPRQVANQRRLEPIQLAAGLFQGQGLQGVDKPAESSPLDSILQILSVAGPIVAAFLSNSRFKEGFEEVDDDDNLDKLRKLPVKKWSYKGQKSRHVGPMAEDFKEAFGLGDSDDTINAVDIIGTVLSATKSLAKKVDKLEKKKRK